jgi:hypothetical protein
MKPLKFISTLVALVLWAITIALAYFRVIPIWAAVVIAILVMFLGGYITLWILRNILGWDRFTDLVVKPQSEELEAVMTKEDQWKTDLLTEHRRLRSLRGVRPDHNAWTRSSDGRLVTEYGNYWAQVMGALDNKFRFTVHQKGQFGYDIVCENWDCATEQEATRGAVAFMREGKRPPRSQHP